MAKMEEIEFTSKKQAAEMLTKFGIEYPKVGSGPNEGKPRETIAVLQERYNAALENREFVDPKKKDKEEEKVEQKPVFRRTKPKSMDARRRR